MTTEPRCARCQCRLVVQPNGSLWCANCGDRSTEAVPQPISCPYCEHEFDPKGMTMSRIGYTEKDHMESAHPEVIEKRLTDAGFVRKGDEWIDTRASDG